VNISAFSAKELIKPEISYNNPVGISLLITSDDKLDRLRIFSVSGRKVFEKGLNTNSASVDLSTLPTGLYFIELTARNYIKIGKLLKE